MAVGPLFKVGSWDGPVFWFTRQVLLYPLSRLAHPSLLLSEAGHCTELWGSRIPLGWRATAPQDPLPPSQRYDYKPVPPLCFQPSAFLTEHAAPSHKPSLARHSGTYLPSQYFGGPGKRILISRPAQDYTARSHLKHKQLSVVVCV